jgi:hypothetical protein
MPLSNFLQDPNKIAVSTAAQVFYQGPGQNSEMLGVIQSLEPSQDRATTAVRGIGTGDRILQRVWQLTEFKLNVQKFALFSKNMLNLFGYNDGFRMLSQLRAPIDIKELLLLPDGTTIRTTIYHGCYLTSFSAPRSISGDIIITESASFDCTYCSDGNNVFDYETGLE